MLSYTFFPIEGNKRVIIDFDVYVVINTLLIGSENNEISFFLTLKDNLFTISQLPILLNSSLTVTSSDLKLLSA